MEISFVISVDVFKKGSSCIYHCVISTLTDWSVLLTDLH